MLHLKILAAQLLGVAALAAIAIDQAAAGGAVEDIQIGEAGSLARVALVCKGGCDIRLDGAGGFFIANVTEALDVDLSARSKLIDRLTLTPEKGGSVLALSLRRPINEARVIRCKSDSGPADCIELRFALNGQAVAEAAKEPSLRAETAPAKPAATPASEKPPFIGKLTLAPRAAPALRDGPEASIVTLPDFAPPERLTPAPAAPPRARERIPALGATRVFSFKEEATAILGKTFDEQGCETARIRLAADAWALDSMIDLAFCKAGAGRYEEADADFARLLAYTPDNYEALVGRGLIALARKDRKRGMDLLQEALNALPPIAESDRIVAAMERN
jgi:tetratricopeptide (TPR) repeat protein